MARKILLTGSRYLLTPEMYQKTRELVVEAFSNKEEILCGDADGIDAFVIRLCDDLAIPLTVYGGYKTFRNKSSREGCNVPFDGDFKERDRHMASLCDQCFAIWNGRSNGTRSTFMAARLAGKEVKVFEYGGEDREETKDSGLYV